jgi:hypothetical protein
LLESLGQVAGKDKELVQGLSSLVEAFEACETSLQLSRGDFTSVMARVESDPHQAPVIRGGAVGALWTLNAADAEQVLKDMRMFADPSHLGDFLTGVFALAREAAQRHPELLRSIKDLVSGYGDEDFLVALPALRLAFTYFTPREKHYLASHLFGPGQADGTPLPALEVSPETAARAMAFENQLFETMKRHGIRDVEAAP